MSALETHREALRLHSAGFSVVPIKLDSTKSPDLYEWREFKFQQPTELQVRKWFTGTNPGLAVIGGSVSGGLECLDFDDHLGCGGVWRQWLDSVPVELIRPLPIYRTPGNGWRVCWHCDHPHNGAKLVLAKRPGQKNGKPTEEPLVELLSNCVCLVPGGNPHAHETGKPYIYTRKHLTDAPLITPEQRQTLIEAAKTFNQCPEPIRERSHARERFTASGANWHAWDDFNLHAKWEDILEPHGWTLAGWSGDVCLWRRPDKHPGISATTNYADLDLFHVFSSSTLFEADRSYNKFAAYAILNCEGDYKVAANELARQGWGRANRAFNY